MAEHNRHHADLLVIGSGLAGTAAACFALARGLKIIQVAATSGEMAFASGMLDLLGVYPADGQRIWENPWAGLAALSPDAPKHPFARLGLSVIRDALEEFLGILEAAGLPYRGFHDRNATVLTAAGTTRPTYRVPASMWNGVIALEERQPTLLVDFVGMKDFSARLMSEVLKNRWPELRSVRLPFPVPFPGGELHNTFLAEALESELVREQIARSIRPHLRGARQVGFPAILGLRAVHRVVGDLEQRIGTGVFEIPTLPPSLPGLRVREGLQALLQDQGARLLQGVTVLSPSLDGRRCTGVTAGTSDWCTSLEADAILLATGRFLGGGLVADRGRIRESVFGLPVTQPPSRHHWHRERFLDPRGHPVNEAGLEIDESFRPLGPDGRYAFENLFAAGSVLGHQDWARTKSGAGLAVATAYGAVEAVVRSRQNSPQ